MDLQKVKCFTNIIQKLIILLYEAIGHANLLYFKGKHPILLHTVTSLFTKLEFSSIMPVRWTLKRKCGKSKISVGNDPFEQSTFDEYIIYIHIPDCINWVFSPEMSS